MKKTSDETTVEERQLELRARLLGSFLTFCQVIHPLLTGRDFFYDTPHGRESHVITICRALTAFFRGQIRNLAINVPPGHGKSTLVTYYMAWAYARYGDCNHIYVSNAHDLASGHTNLLKAILTMPEYQQMFGVTVDKNNSARDNFKTTSGGSVVACGVTGSIVGKNAGYPHSERYTGCMIWDDLHKPEDVHRDTARQEILRACNETLRPRIRGNNVGIIAIGQRLHEDDIFSYIASGKDGRQWEFVLLPAEDQLGNILAPSIISRERLLAEKQHSPYVYWSQYQQTPQPSGGSIFKHEWFLELEKDPEFTSVFITIDTAETDKTYNDATVMSLWGTYDLQYKGADLKTEALHWIDCIEIRVEPYELKNQFMSFYGRAVSTLDVQPSLVAIEKKSTGVSLISDLRQVQGLNIYEINRNITSGCKTKRMLDIQPYVARRLVTFPKNGRHNAMCIEHMSKITANGSHKHDDIADTLCDAIRLGLIERTIPSKKTTQKMKELSEINAQNQNTLRNIRGNRNANYIKQR
jgi:predicted phage terminase large subunit-like protein